MKRNVPTGKEHGLLGLGYYIFTINKCSERYNFTSILLMDINFVSEDLRSKFCCRESERYKFTWFFLKTFFSSWALSVKLERKWTCGKNIYLLITVSLYL